MRTRLALAVIAAVAALTLIPSVSQAAPCTPPVTNQVACENTQPGADPDTWQIDKAGDDSIQGYATQMSVNKGQTVQFKIKSTSANFHIDILRLGYYGGDGARLMQGGIAPTGPSTNQPPCDKFADTGLIDCGNWAVTASWAVPSTAVSGVYIAHLVRNDGAESHITFVVRDDSSTSDVVLQTSDSTWQAYNTYGGNSLYTCDDPCPPGNPSTYKSAYAVSYNRPFNTAADDGGRSALFSGGEFPMIRWLERNGFDVSYISSVDTSRNPALLRQHKLFVSSGHDEYWSASQRASMEAARDAGTNLAFFSGNTGFWKTRFGPSQSGTVTQDRTLTSYKDTHFNEQQDPVTFTGTWRDPRFTTAADGIKPENALSGQSFLVNAGTSNITVPFAYKNLRLWKNTAATSLTAGQRLALAPSTLGYEWDIDADNGFRPAGQVKLSSTTVNGLEVFSDYGSTVKQNGTATHNLTMYKAPSGARVFNSGTVQWAWGLDPENGGNTPEDRNMQQATVNLLADMGAQPGTRQSNLVAAAATTDTAKPTSTITSPPASVADGQSVTITGTAADTGGGVVAGVEVSTDDGATWHPATSGTTSWSYTWIAKGNPSTKLRSRATDDSGNIETPAAGVSVAVTCPCSIWGSNVAPGASEADGQDASPAELGVKFRSDKFGTISALRFYKAAANTGTHTGSIWSADGQRLAQATFTGESASGWQTVTFSNPVSVEPNTTYIASYYAPKGHFAATPDYFHRNPAPGPNGGALLGSSTVGAMQNTGQTVDGTTNGVFAYSGSSTFPSGSYGATNYWVDVVFAPAATPGAVSNVTATAGGTTSANVSWTAPSSGGAVTSYKITPYVGTTAQTPKTVTGTPPVTNTTISGLTTGTTYTFTVQALNPNGGGPVSAQSSAVTPQGAVAPAAPTSVIGQGASQSAKLTWTAPGADGDSPITGYTVTPYVGSAAQTPTQVAGTGTSATVTGLTNGTSYTFRVTAKNAVGTSPESSPSAAVIPQATIFDFGTPATADAADPSAVELGVKFRADTNGQITGIRFYKSAANLGTHTGSLWAAAGGPPLATATFSNESASGWQTATFSSPVNITAGTTYVASYFAPLGHYSVTGGGLETAVDNGPLHAIANGTSANGVYSYGATSTFPTSTYRGANYWVDVLYAVPAPGAVATPTAESAGGTSAKVTWTAPASGGPVDSYKITPYAGATALAPVTAAGSLTTKTVTGLTSGTSYRFTVQAINANGAGAVSPQSNVVTPQAAVAPDPPTGVVARPATSSAQVTWTASASDGDSAITGQTVTPYLGATAQAPVQVGAAATSATVTGLANGSSYTFKVSATNAVGTSPQSAASAAVVPRATIFDFATPATADSGEADPINVGVKFTADVSGQVTGVRFYKAATNTGSHVGSLYAAGGGAPLAQATFANETASGWQSVLFASPVNVTAGTTYVASYFAPNGHYSATANGLSSAVDNGLLHAVANGTSANGVFAYGSAPAFPNASFQAGNYWVDVLYAGGSAPGQVTGVTATAGQSAATVSWSAPAGGGSATSYKITPYIGAAAQTATTVTGTPPATTKTITGLTAGTAYTFTVQAINPGGSGAVSAPSNAVTPLGAGAPGVPTGVSAQADTKSANVDWVAPASDGGSAITGYRITPYAGATAGTPVNAGATATRLRVTGLTNGTAYTFRVAAVNAGGTGTDSAASSAVTPKASILELATPGVVDAGDNSAVNLGVKFRSSVAGQITGLRFYKSASNTGTHVGTLWAAGGGAPLAQATFSSESASGWQTVTFASPVAITANTTYVASYLAPKGGYSATGSAFSSGALANPPLTALSNADGPNGVYAYSGTSTFPTSSWNATNYWVDVLFAPGA